MNPKRESGTRRRGAASILAVILAAVLIGMLAFSIDVGFVASSKSEIQRTADAAALAGCWQLYESKVAGTTDNNVSSQVHAAAQKAAQLNNVCNTTMNLASTTSSQSDVTIGYLDSLSSTAISSDPTGRPYQAVRVMVRKSSAQNGKVPFFFARVFGQSGMNMDSDATAAMAVQIKGFKPPASASENLDILPFALDLQTWQALQNGGGSDNYGGTSSYSNSSSGDGIREVNLYPQGTGSPGNRGTVDIGGSNNSTADIARQILHGISGADLAALGKPLMLDTDGQMTLNGDTGISAGVKDELASIIGQKRVIPVFSTVTGNGNNATYRIVKWVGVKIMYVKLTGSMSSKQVIIQPAPILVRNVHVNTSGTSTSDGLFSPVVLVQ
jgi:Flp pilus assembly protein TadG